MVLGWLKKGWSLISRPAIAIIRLQAGRRGAERLPDGVADAKPEMDEALAVLAGGRGPAGLGTEAKALFSDRPEAFGQDKVRRWVGDARVKAAVREATTRANQGLPVDGLRSTSLILWEEITGERREPAAELFDFAVNFVRLSLRAPLSAADRIGIDNANANRDIVLDALDERSSRIDRRLAALSDAGASSVPSSIVDDHIRNGVVRATRRRGFVEADEAAELAVLAVRARDGDLRGGTDGARLSLFRATAAAHARADDHAMADAWLETARRLAPGADLSVDRARVDLVKGDVDAALRAVRDGTGPEARLIMLAAVARRDGAAAALELHRSRGQAPTDLDGAGLFALARWMADEGRAEQALGILRSASPEQVHDAPALLFTRARLAVSLCLPEAARARARLDLAFLPPPEILRDDAEASLLLQSAHADAAALRVDAEGLGLRAAMAKALEMEVWAALASGSPALADGARTRLGSMLADVPAPPAAISLACTFGVAFDRTSAARGLEEAATLGGWTPDQAMAALDLALSSNSPGDVLDLLERRWTELATHIDGAWLQAIRVEALAHEGRLDEARSALRDGPWGDGPQGVDFRERASLVVDRAAGQDVVARLEAVVADRGEPADLIQLVGALRDARDERGLARHLPGLWRMRRRVEDAREACRAIERIGDDDGLAAFLGEVGAEVERDRLLGLSAARRFVRASDFAGATRMLGILEAGGAPERDLRTLRIDLAMETGAWDDLHPVVATDLREAGERDPRELLASAHIGQAIGSRLEADLMDRAVARAPDDPHVLLAAYLATVKRGEEATDARAPSWIRRAAELSGEDGPVRAEGLAEAAEIIREQREQARSLSEMAFQGDVPLTLAVGRLNVTLSELILGVLPANADKDPRQRLPVPLFAAGRPRTDLTGVDVVGMDLGALLLQAHLGLLESTFAAFERVVVPAGTLTNLLEDMGRLRIQQPSQVHEARRVVAALDGGRLRTLPPAPTDARLAAEAGDGFALLLAGAAARGCRLVHVPPVPRLGSNLEVAVELGVDATRMTDPSSVLDCLSRYGALEPDVEAACRSRLERAGALDAWDAAAPLEPADGLVLDDVALHHLSASGALEATLATFATVWIGPWTAERARALLAGAASGDRLIADVEGLRATMAAAIASGKVVVAPRARPHAADARRPGERRTPLEGLVVEPGDSQALVFDDRYVNAHSQSIGRAGRALPVACTLDVLEALVARGAIDDGRRRAVRHRLRRCGALLVPADAAELASAALRPVSGGNTVPELRAVADGVGLAMVRGAVRRPRDLPWLGGLSIAVLEAIRTCWREAPDTAAAIAAGERLLDLLPRPAEWCPPQDGGDDGWRAEAEGLILLSLSRAPTHDDPGRRRAYAEWVDARVVAPLRAADPVTFDAVVDRKKDLLLGMLDPDAPMEALAGLDAEHVRAARIVAARDLVRALPGRMRDRVLEDERIRSLCGLTGTMRLGRAGVSRDELVRVAAAHLDGRAFPPLVDTTGAPLDVEIVEGDGALTFSLDGGTCVLPRAGVLSESTATRLAALDDALTRSTLAASTQERLRAGVAAATPDADGYVAFLRALETSPQDVSAAVVRRLAEDRSQGAEDLVPPSDATFVALAGEAGDASTLDQFARGGFRSAVRLATARDPAGGLALHAPCYVARSLGLATPAADLRGADVLAAVGRMRLGGDPFGLLAALELCASRPSDEGFAEAGEAVLSTLAVGMERSTKLFCGAAFATLGVLARRGGLAMEPVFHRRVSALAWAGHLVRVLMPVDVDVEDFLEEAMVEFMPEVSATVGRERVVDPAWLPDWLSPEVLAAQVRGRAEEIVDGLGDAAPPTWTAALGRIGWAGSETTARVRAMWPGPLDGMDPAWTGSPKLDSADVAALVDRIDDASDASDGGLTVTTFATVDEPDRASLGGAVARRLAAGASGGGAWREGARAALHLAGVWKDADLADHALRCLLLDDGGPVQDRPDPMRLALDAAATATDAVAWRARIVASLDLVASNRLERWQALALDRGMTVLCVGDPGLAGALARARHLARMRC